MKVWVDINTWDRVNDVEALPGSFTLWSGPILNSKELILYTPSELDELLGDALYEMASRIGDGSSQGGTDANLIDGIIKELKKEGRI